MKLVVTGVTTANGKLVIYGVQVQSWVPITLSLGFFPSPWFLSCRGIECTLGWDRPQHDRIVSTYYDYPLGFAYANEIPAVLPMLCMLAARDSAERRAAYGAARRRDRLLRLFIMRHRYVGDESRSAANISANLRILPVWFLPPGGIMPTWYLVCYDFNGILPFHGRRDLLCRTWGTCKPRKNISFMQITRFIVPFPRKRSLAFRVNFNQSGIRFRCVHGDGFFLLLP